MIAKKDRPQIRVSDKVLAEISHAAIDAGTTRGQMAEIAWDAYNRLRVRALLLLEETGTAEELKGIDFALKPYIEKVERGEMGRKKEKLA